VDEEGAQAAAAIQAELVPAERSGLDLLSKLVGDAHTDAGRLEPSGLRANPRETDRTTRECNNHSRSRHP
jgi:hypothetical protein